MPTYDVTSGPDNEVVLVMKAESPDTIPTSITGPDQSLVKYAKELVDDFEASAIAIASRMGWGAQLVPQDDDGGTSRLNAALEKARGKTTDVQKEAEVDVSAGDIIKTDMDKRLVFGWAYVTHDKEGELNIDKSGDFADDIEEIEKSAYDFVLKSRQGDADHTNVTASEMVESIVFTPEKIEKMGIAPGTVPMGWWIGFKVQDDAVWERVRKGELKAFSIHGKGTRNKVE